MSAMQPVLVVMMDAEGNRNWKSDLPAAPLNLLLDAIKQDILTGRMQAAPSIITPGNGDIAHIKRVQP